MHTLDALTPGFDALPLCVLVCKPTGSLVFANRFAKATLPSDWIMPGEVLGLMREGVAGGFPAQRLVQALSDCAASPSSSIELTLQLAGEVKHRLDICVRGLAITNQSNCCLLVVRDITEGFRLQLGAMQAENAASLGALAGQVSHDFGNLLSPVLTYSEALLKAENLDAGQQKWLQRIFGAAQRGRKMTQQLMQASLHIEDEGGKGTTELSACLAMLLPGPAHEANIEAVLGEFEARVPADEPASVAFDSDTLHGLLNEVASSFGVQEMVRIEAQWIDQVVEYPDALSALIPGGYLVLHARVRESGSSISELRTTIANSFPLAAACGLLAARGGTLQVGPGAELRLWLPQTPLHRSKLVVQESPTTVGHRNANALTADLSLVLVCADSDLAQVLSDQLATHDMSCKVVSKAHEALALVRKGVQTEAMIVIECQRSEFLRDLSDLAEGWADRPLLVLASAGMLELHRLVKGSFTRARLLALPLDSQQLITSIHELVDDL